MPEYNYLHQQDEDSTGEEDFLDISRDSNWDDVSIGDEIVENEHEVSTEVRTMDQLMEMGGRNFSDTVLR